MNARLHGMQDEIKVGDIVETSLGVGEVTRVVSPMREVDQAMLEINLGRKWLKIEQVHSIIRRAEAPTTREEPEAHWDEHE